MTPRSSPPRPERRPTRLLGLACMLLVSACHSALEPSRALGIQVIYATNHGQTIDPRLRPLVGELGSLKFTSYQLRDEATFRLEPGSAGRLQLPNQSWLSLTDRGMAEDGKLRLEIAVPELQFKTTVALANGATVAVGGPPFADGALILAVTRLQPNRS